MKIVKILTLVLVTCFTSAAFGQMSIGVNYSPLFPISKYNGEVGNSFVGATVKLNYHLDDYLSVNVATGFYGMSFTTLNVSGVQTDVSDVSLNIIPATLGATFRFSADKLKPYVAIDLGYAYTMQGESEYAASTNRGNFLIAPSLGVLYNLNENLALNASLKNNILLYRYRDIEDYNETFQLLSLELGMNYKF